MIRCGSAQEKSTFTSSLRPLNLDGGQDLNFQRCVSAHG
jgi:hypothetical protein